MSIAGKSLHILVPMYGGMCLQNFFQSFHRLVVACMKFGVTYSFTLTYNESLVPRARNRLVDEYLKNHAETHALFIDADIGFDEQDILTMLEMDRDIIGPGCVKKNIRWDRIQKAIKKNGREYSNEELSRIGGDYVFNFERFQGQRDIQLGEPQEVKHLGTGLMMIRRNVFETFIEKYPERWYESRGDLAALPGPIHDFFRIGIDPETREYDSEDYGFCSDCRAIGFKVWMCPWMKTSHMGSYTFVGDLPMVAKLTGAL